MQVTISSSLVSPTLFARSLSSSNGSKNIIPYKMRDQMATPWPAVPSLDLTAMIRGENHAAYCQHVRKAYRQIPMDTAGAYRLIDDETGESSIVWGGVDDDPNIPSKEALSFKPRDNPGPGQRGRKIVSSSVGSFSRLKVPKIKTLMKNSLQVGAESRNSSIKASSFATLLDETSSVDSNTDFARQEASIGMPMDRELKGFPVSNARRRIVSSRDTLTKELRPSDADESSFRVNSPYRRWNDADSKQSNDAAAKKLHKKLPHDSGFFSRKSFRDLGCSDIMIESLRKQSIIRPANIQAMAYNPVLEGKSCFIADQSGSGKTLAYLVPVVQRLREEELSGLGKSSSRNPRVVIFSPTAELASQLLQNCRSMAKSGIPFRSAIATGGFRQKTQLEALHQELDVLIATPGRFMFLLQEGHIQLNNLKCVVLDEVDILFGDEDFEPVLQNFIRSAPITVQYLFVTATLPVNIYHKLIEIFPDSEVVMGPGMHRTSSRLDEVLVDCSGAEGEEKNPDTAFLNKKTALLKLVEESPVPKTIIFCNKIETCRKVENALKRFDRRGTHMKILPFHAAMDQKQRLPNMDEFLKSESEESMFLICTDRASRGVDFLNVDHVVLFDFPRDPSEYVRRVGRTARGAMGIGKAFVFVVGKQVSLAKRIIERKKKGHPLHDVPNAYELQSSVL